mmetsp:Transcript_35843/g.65089  ORF Transcript_35843/g.65089 Transcript_35843/m.65089 type:complete len:286 (-) Transcript_35843:492-1349(-)
MFDPQRSRFSCGWASICCAQAPLRKVMTERPQKRMIMMTPAVAGTRVLEKVAAKRGVTIASHAYACTGKPPSVNQSRCSKPSIRTRNKDHMLHVAPNWFKINNSRSRERTKNGAYARYAMVGMPLSHVVDEEKRRGIKASASMERASLVNNLESLDLLTMVFGSSTTSLISGLGLWEGSSGSVRVSTVISGGGSIRSRKSQPNSSVSDDTLNSPPMSKAGSFLTKYPEPRKYSSQHNAMTQTRMIDPGPTDTASLMLRSSACTLSLLRLTFNRSYSLDCCFATSC